MLQAQLKEDIKSWDLISSDPEGPYLELIDEIASACFDTARETVPGIEMSEIQSLLMDLVDQAYAEIVESQKKRLEPTNEDVFFHLIKKLKGWRPRDGPSLYRPFLERYTPRRLWNILVASTRVEIRKKFLLGESQATAEPAFFHALDQDVGTTEPGWYVVLITQNDSPSWWMFYVGQSMDI